MKFHRSSKVELSRVGDRSVLYHSELERAIVLNTTGSQLWDALAQPQAENEITELLQQKFPDVSRDQVAADVSAYLGSLREHGLIVESDAH